MSVRALDGYIRTAPRHGNAMGYAVQFSDLFFCFCVYFYELNSLPPPLTPTKTVRDPGDKLKRMYPLLLPN